MQTKIKIIISTAGAIGTAKYDAYIGNADNLKSNQVVTDRVINGQYQPLASGLEIRFSGSADNSTATLNDEWEIEVFGKTEHVDNSSSIRSTRMSRRFG